MSNIYLHPCLCSDPMTIWAAEEVMRMRAVVEGHRVQLVPRAEPVWERVVNNNTAIQAKEEK